MLQGRILARAQGAGAPGLGLDTRASRNIENSSPCWCFEHYYRVQVILQELPHFVLFF